MASNIFNAKVGVVGGGQSGGGGSLLSRHLVDVIQDQVTAKSQKLREMFGDPNQSLAQDRDAVS